MTWEYLLVLNSLLQILVTIAIGSAASFLGILSERFIPQAVTFVFYVALPCLIIKGIATGIDFYTDENVWPFIVAFLVLRFIALILAFLVILFTNWKQKRREKGLGHVAVLWLSLTWISTVILGIPICTAVFGNPSLGIKYGILAGMSSFIFQLPLQLLFFECHAAEAEEEFSANLEQISPLPISIEEVATDTDVETEHQILHNAVPVTNQASNIHPNNALCTFLEEGRTSQMKGTSSLEDHRRWYSLVHVENISNAKLWLKICNKVIRNPVLLGISLGLVLSLSTGGKYLKCPSETCIQGLAWISNTLGWLGACVSPVSLFAMGLWTHEQHMTLLSMHVLKLLLYMLSKLVIMPLTMVGLAHLMKLSDEAGRAAILISALPISMASFSLGKQYKLGETDLSVNVAMGTLLMLPTVLLWNMILDHVGVYPITSA